MTPLVFQLWDGSEKSHRPVGRGMQQGGNDGAPSLSTLFACGSAVLWNS